MTSGYIDEFGRLHIYRSERKCFNAQKCIHKDAPCDDSCPLFSNPEDRYVDTPHGDPTYVYGILICNNRVIVIMPKEEVEELKNANK